MKVVSQNVSSKCNPKTGVITLKIRIFDLY